MHLYFTSTGCPDGWDSVGSISCYLFMSEPRNVPVAQYECTSLGGYLWEIDDMVEYHNVWNNIVPGNATRKILNNKGVFDFTHPIHVNKKS